MDRADDQQVKLTGARISCRLNIPVIAARPALSSIPSPGRLPAPADPVPVLAGLT